MGSCCSYCEEISTRIKLRKTTKENCQEFSLRGMKKYVKVIDVYDGDTMTVSFIFRGKIYQTKVRLYGVDTPELRPRLNVQDRKKEIAKANIAKDFVREKCQNRIVLAEFIDKKEKFGRHLANIFVDDDNLSQLLIQKGLGKEYYGGKK